MIMRFQKQFVYSSQKSPNIGNTTPYSIKIKLHTMNSLVFDALFEVTYVVTHQLEVGHRSTKDFSFLLSNIHHFNLISRNKYIKTIVLCKIEMARIVYSMMSKY